MPAPHSLSLHVRGLRPSATVAINERSNALLAAGHTVYKLGLGQSPFPVPPSVVEALRDHAPRKEYMPVRGHPPLRAAVEKGAALVPSSKKRGGLGTAIDVPLGHKDAAFVRSHFDAMEARIGDAPRASEIVVAVVVTDSGRPLARVGGLKASEIKGEDGLR